LSKSLGSGNPSNVVKATLEGLKQLKDPAEIEKLRRVESYPVEAA
jgi:ribosomal protein S5